MGAGETAYGVIWGIIILGLIIYIALDSKLRTILAKNHILLMIAILFAICVLTFGLLLMTGNTTMETFASEQAPGCFT
jgi:cell shape-determining protein MreD